jgi:hypothetical protein
MELNDGYNVTQYEIKAGDVIGDFIHDTAGKKHYFFLSPPLYRSTALWTLDAFFSFLILYAVGLTP